MNAKGEEEKKLDSDVWYAVICWRIGVLSRAVSSGRKSKVAAGSRSRTILRIDVLIAAKIEVAKLSAACKQSQPAVKLLFLA